MPTDVPIKSISISSRSRVLCVATDSSCYMRAGVQKDKTIGSHWLHLPREMQNICHVSAGRNVITAIDDRGNDKQRFFKKTFSKDSDQNKHCEEVCLQIKDNYIYRYKGYDAFFVCLFKRLLTCGRT